jgi:hypothetical protein
MRNLLLFLWLFFLVTVGGATGLAMSGCGASAVVAPALTDDVHRRYHDGERWINVRVALDRLEVERAGAGTEQQKVEVYLLRKPVASVAELNEVTRQMKEAQKDIQRFSAYGSVGEDFQSQPQRITNQVVVRGSAGQDLETLAIRCGARVVERVDYSPDTAICVATGSSLLAAFDAADALRQQPGVLLAMPLMERSRDRRSR